MTIETAIAPKVDAFSFSKDARRPAIYLHHFADVMLGDPRIRGRVLDVGCGVNGPAFSRNKDVVRAARQLDGIDPFPGVVNNPFLTEKWHGEFDENAPIPADTYDAIVTFQVVEHVADPAKFLRAAFRVLKPGGVFFATTPHNWHPFCWAVKTLEVTGMKAKLAEHDEGINKIPSYYRLNSRRTVRKFAQAAGFSKATFHYFPGLWAHNFPKLLRWAPHTYDWLFGYRMQSCALQFMFSLEKPK